VFSLIHLELIKMSETQVTIWKGKNENGKMSSFAEYTDEHGDKIKMVCVHYGGLFVYKNGDLIFKPGQGNSGYVMIWTRISALFGAQDLLARLKR
jgi:hypothetical protein